MSGHDHTFQEDNYVSTYIMPLKGDIMNFQHHNMISYIMNEQNFKLLSFDKVASCIHNLDNYYENWPQVTRIPSPTRLTAASTSWRRRWGKTRKKQRGNLRW